MEDVKVDFRWVMGADSEIPLPAYETEGAVGLDIRANLEEGYRFVGIKIPPGGCALVPTGLQVAVPTGYELQIRPRSGLAISKRITVLNTPGTIDNDFRGEVNVVLVNYSNSTFTIRHGMRIAQFVLAPVTRLVWQNVEELPETKRSIKGFGSTGL